MMGEVEYVGRVWRVKREDTIGFSACCRILFGTTKIVLNWSVGLSTTVKTTYMR